MGPTDGPGPSAIIDAAKAVNGDVEDAAKFMNALMHVNFDSPKGHIALDKYGNVNQSMYIRKVEKVNGTFQNTAIATYPEPGSILALHRQGIRCRSNTRLRELKGSMTDCSKNLAKKIADHAACGRPRDGRPQLQSLARRRKHHVPQRLFAGRPEHPPGRGQS